MKYLWLFILPLLFLPDLGQVVRTPFGTLELSDFLMAPYLVAVLFAARPRLGMRLYAASCCLGLFLGWALLSTLLMSSRYHTMVDTQLEFSLLKLGKFTLYAAAGLLTASALTSAEARRGFMWALLAAVAVLGVSLFLVPTSYKPGDALIGYTDSNALSVMLAMLLCYLGGAFVMGLGTVAWRRAAAVLLPVALIGSTFSDGRGGWVAGVAGAAYLAVVTRIRLRTMCTLAIALCLVIVAYFRFPAFAHQVDVTLWPNPTFLTENQQGVLGVDDGARTRIWMLQAPHILDAPVLGTGFYHRGPETGLYSSGSHNFWLQMLLETGVPGGVLMLGFLVMLWNHAGIEPAGELRLTHPVRAALVAAFVGTLSGEYFYGGTPWFSLFMVYASVGSLPAEAIRLVRRRALVVAQRTLRPRTQSARLTDTRRTGRLPSGAPSRG